MKKKTPVFQDQKTIKEKEKEIQREHIEALKQMNEELQIVFKYLNPLSK